MRVRFTLILFPFEFSIPGAIWIWMEPDMETFGCLMPEFVISGAFCSEIEPDMETFYSLTACVNTSKHKKLKAFRFFEKIMQ